MVKFNGYDVPVIGLPQPGRAARPVTSPVRARVLDTIREDPEVKGPAGKAWMANLERIRASIPEEVRRSDGTQAIWIVEAPWSHPVVHSYAIILMHLRPLPDRPLNLCLEGATHEMHVWGLAPDAKRERLLQGGINPKTFLKPINFAGQFIEKSDEAAAARVAEAVGMICLGRLSPDSDHIRAWATLFGDSMLSHRRVEKVIKPV